MPAFEHSRQFLLNAPLKVKTPNNSMHDNLPPVSVEFSISKSQ